jgi:hypothetical protein
MIARNLYQVVQCLARHRKHSEHVVLWRIRRNGEPMKMQICYVNTGIHRAYLVGLRRKMIDIGNFENVTGRNADNRHCDTVESEGIPAVFVYCMK